MADFRRPLLPGPQAFEGWLEAADPTAVSATGERIAHLLVRGTDERSDDALVERVLRLVDTEGLATIAELWSAAPSDTVAGCLWRLYLLHTWVHRQPDQAAREYAAGLAHTPVQNVVAGLGEAPSPEDVAALVDAVFHGLIRSDFDVALDRAAAFAHVASVGRAQLDSGDPHSAARLFDLARHLRRAAALERDGRLA
ncbi:MAG: hypothetical protein QM621_10415 [Aeromicrobium sp.]|uniref:hypothetical protein n=1 Tax=Aeromicrobium sp. TaxID=1871063 RepID=UPI0039E51EA2